MPSFTRRNHWTTVVWFPDAETPDRYGRKHADYAPPVELIYTNGSGVRLEQVFNTGETATGFTANLDYVMHTDRTIRDGWIYIGSLAQWNSAGSGSDEGELLRVVRHQRVPNLNRRKIYHEVGLMYEREENPEAGL